MLNCHLILFFGHHVGHRRRRCRRWCWCCRLGGQRPSFRMRPVDSLFRVFLSSQHANLELRDLYCKPCFSMAVGSRTCLRPESTKRRHKIFGTHSDLSGCSQNTHFLLLSIRCQLALYPAQERTPKVLCPVPPLLTVHQIFKAYRIPTCHDVHLELLKVTSSAKSASPYAHRLTGRDCKAI